jgi:hypothetical protein
MSADASPSRRRRVFLILLVLLLLVTLGGYGLFRQWTAVPDLFADADARLRAIPEPQRLELARQIEMRVPTQVSRRLQPDEDGSRRLEASFEEINAWLNLRLEKYLNNQGIAWPEGVNAVLVAEQDGQLVVAADVDLPQLRQIVSVFFEIVEVDPERVAQDSQDADADADPPSLAIRIARITAGRVPLPRARLAALVREQLGPAAQREDLAELLDALATDQAVPIPELKIDAVRRGSVRSLELSPRGVVGDLRIRRVEADM